MNCSRASTSLLTTRTGSASGVLEVVKINVEPGYYLVMAFFVLGHTHDRLGKLGLVLLACKTVYLFLLEEMEGVL